MITVVDKGNDLSSFDEMYKCSYPLISTILEKQKENDIPGKNYTGWMKLPMTDENIINQIEDSAQYLKDKIDVLIVIGIGGSFLGAKASYDFLQLKYNRYPDLIFSGYNISPESMKRVLGHVEGKRFAINFISKSGTTLEPSVAMRFFLDVLTKRVGISKRKDYVFATTDPVKGFLKTIAETEKWKTFAIPQDIGGRFSVLSPVGLFPLAVAGADIREILKGAANQKIKSENPDIKNNPSAIYSLLRFNFLLMNFNIELFVSWMEHCINFGLWWQQLFGESEGKNNKGIFPSTAFYTRDLHSIGQYVQEGKRMLFETFLWIENQLKLTVPDNDINDGLSYLTEKQYYWINEMAKNGTKIAHQNGGVPIIEINVKNADEYNLGELFYFFQESIFINSYLLNVNTYNQPGVEAYKKAMFKLLGKPE